MDILIFIARLLLAAVFFVAGLAKLADRKGTRQAVIDFGLPTRLATPINFTLPAVELGIAVVLIPSASGWWGALGAFALLFLFTVGIAVNLAKGRKPVCHCFGQLDSAPIGWQTLTRNIGLAAVAGLLLSQGWLDLYSERVGEFVAPLLVGGVGLMAAMGVAVGGLFLGQSWLLLRLQTRVRALEGKLAAVDSFLASATVPSAYGLSIGVPAPAFQLQDPTGGIVTREDLLSKGKAVLLVFVDPACTSCEALLPDLGRWQRDYAAQLTMATISRGEPEENQAKAREFGLNVLLQKKHETVFAYRAFATPSAVVIRPDGKTASTLAVGTAEVRELVQNTIRGVQGGQQPQQAMQKIATSAAVN